MAWLGQASLRRRGRSGSGRSGNGRSGAEEAEEAEAEEKFRLKQCLPSFEWET
jgi:hypothetical protein